MIQTERIQVLNPGIRFKGDYVLYWMQSSQRVSYNHALEYAIDEANKMGMPVVVALGLTEHYPGANLRHYHFMLEGLREVQCQLKARKIAFVVRLGEPAEVGLEMARRACRVVVDRGYTRHQRQWRAEAARKIDCPLIQVESDVVFPVEAISDKEEYAARTLRPKITANLEVFLKPLTLREVRTGSLKMGFESLDLTRFDALLAGMNLDKTVSPSPGYRGGTSQAQAALAEFIENRIDRYDTDRNDPTLQGCSGLSPYLHFGQISPLEIALAVIRAGGKGVNPFLEELIVRRELAINYIHYNLKYDAYESLPAWARATLKEHQSDKRETPYRLAELEAGRTHDPYWNAAQNEMRITGKMHGYMRMYWGKKIIEWSPSPRTAFATALALNDKYELDGRDPSGYTGVAWCFGKHDRPWASRPILGCLRYMNDNGLKRKFDADAYVRNVAALNPAP